MCPYSAPLHLPICVHAALHAVCPRPCAYTSPTRVLCLPAGQLAVSAVVKVSHGHLFPLPGALLFVEKPALFVPHADLLGAEWRRVQSATFDLVLHVAKPGEPCVILQRPYDSWNPGRSCTAVPYRVVSG